MNPIVTEYIMKRRVFKMKKICLLIFMTTVLCLTACGTDKKDEALENSTGKAENAYEGNSYE